jgi:hypothetical protein
VEQSKAKGLSADSWRDGFAQEIDNRRRAARERISEQRKRLQEFDAQLTSKLDEATAQLGAAQQAATTSATGSKERESSLKDWQQRLDEHERQFERRKAELESEHKRLHASLQEQLELNRRQAEASREEAVRHAAQLEQARQESQAELERLRAAAVASKAGAVQALSGKFDPLFAKLTEHETLLSEINRLLEQQAAQKSSSLPAETAAEMAALRQENKTLAVRLKEAQGFSEQIEPLVTRLTEQEATLGEMSRKLDEQAAKRKSSATAEIENQLAALRDENKALVAQLNEKNVLSEQIEPLSAKLVEQETLLGEMSRKLDEQAARKTPSQSPETAAELAALREENKSLAARQAEAAALSEQIKPLLAKLAEQESTLSEMSRVLETQGAQKTSSLPAETAAEMAALRQENKALAAQLKQSHALSEQIEPLVAKLAGQEAKLGEMGRKLDEETTKKSTSEAAKKDADLAALREENKALIERQNETAAISKQMEPLLARLSEQETLLSEMSRKLDEDAARKSSSAATEAEAQLSALREENKALAARQKETAALSGQIEPLLTKLTEQELMLGEMSRKLDEDVARKSSSAATETDSQLAALRDENKMLLARLNGTDALSERIEPLLTRLAEQETLLSEMSRKLDDQAVRKSSSEDAANAEELVALRRENRSLAARLAEAESAVGSEGGGGTGGPEIEDLRRRFEMAVQDVRELKTKNADLAEQLANAKHTATAAASTQAAGTGWEALKQKLLNDLESDFDDNNAQHKADKLTVQGAIKITDDVVAEKEREVAELRRLLDTQAQQVGEMAVGAAAVAQLLDTDELVRQERESLARLQESLREQLKQAEVDNSLERAKLARERLELDEKMRTMEIEKAQLPANTGETAGDKGKQGKGRKWLQRLGLGENKEE